jgi:carbon storage regulator
LSGPPNSRRNGRMLVISRNSGERFAIGENVTVTVISVNRGKVRLGIVAPKEVAIRRDDYRPKVEVKP